MSGDNEKAVLQTFCCASCGIAEIDDIKLVPCDGCDLVKYCSDECKRDHKSEHKEECKTRAAELRDELLFKQPESTHKGDCPICMVPLPIHGNKSVIYCCCSKLICYGCVVANTQRNMEMRLPHSCPFCRESTFITDEEQDKLEMKRIEMNDPVAICKEGGKQYDKGEYRSAFEYWTKAAVLGEIEAHYRLSHLYREGKGVEKDEGKEIFHMEEAAIGGHPNARHNLGAHEWKQRNVERAVKHWVIAARQGNDNSMKTLLDFFKEGYLNKDDLAATLRAHKAAADATKSKLRDFAEKVWLEKCSLE